MKSSGRNNKMINRRGEELLKWVEEEGWGIINGAKEGDREREMTFIGGRGETVIDYVLGDRMAWERTERLEVGGKIDSDHRSLTIWLEEEIREIIRNKRKREKEKWEMRED